MNKAELDAHFENNKYLKQVQEDWENYKDDLMKQVKAQQGLSDDGYKRDGKEKDDKSDLADKQRENLDKILMGSHNLTGPPSSLAEFDNNLVSKDVQGELNNAMAKGNCDGIRTTNGYFYATANEDGSNTLYVDPRWLKNDYNEGISGKEDYLNDIKKIVGDNSDFKISAMDGSFKDLPMNDFIDTANDKYGVYTGNANTPKLAPPTGASQGGGGGA